MWHQTLNKCLVFSVRTALRYLRRRVVPAEMTVSVAPRLTNCVTLESPGGNWPLTDILCFSKNKKHGTEAPCFLEASNNCKPPIRLLQRRVRRRCAASREITDHTRLVGVESARSGGLRRNWVATDVITRQRRASADRTHRELVAALGAARQNVVNQVGRGRSCTRRWRQLSKRLGIAGRRIGGRIRYCSRVDRANGTDRRRFVGRHTRTEQVRDGNRCDDQNDRHDDQQFDKGESFLLFQDKTPHFRILRY